METLHWADYIKFFVALMVIVNPISALPLFVSMTVSNSHAEKMQIARVAGISVAVVLSLAVVLGQPILALFGITIASFKVGGAILIMLMAISMMQAAPTRQRQTPEEAMEAQNTDSIAVVPLAIPLLAGPGAISTTIVFATERVSLLHTALIVFCCLLVAGSAWLMLRLATPVSRWLGETGVNIATRLMGLLLAAVAVEIFASGLLVLLPGLG
jgi:multiple antibiotic resistance protein